GVEVIPAAHAAEQHAGGAEEVDHAVPASGDVVAGRADLGEGHADDSAAQVLHVEWRVAGGQVRIRERAVLLEAVEAAVVHLDYAAVKIGGVEHRLVL